MTKPRLKAVEADPLRQALAQAIARRDDAAIAAKTMRDGADRAAQAIERAEERLAAASAAVSSARELAAARAAESAISGEPCTIPLLAEARSQESAARDELDAARTARAEIESRVPESEAALARAEEDLRVAALEVFVGELLAAPRRASAAASREDFVARCAELRLGAEHLRDLIHARGLRQIREIGKRDGWVGSNVPAGDGDGSSLLGEVEGFLSGVRLAGDGSWRSHPALARLREWHDALLRSADARLE